MKTSHSDVRKQSMLTYMRENGMDYLIVTSPTNVNYFTGVVCNPHERFLAFTLDAHTGTEKLFVPLLDQPETLKHMEAAHVVPIADTDNAYEVLKKHIHDGITSVGVEKDAVSLAKAEQLLQVFGEVRLEDLGPFILSLRMKKSTEEIDKVRIAVELVEKVVDHARSYAKVGMTELDLTAEIEYQMRKFGADRPAFESIVLTGARTALPHGVPGAYPIQPGDFVLIDIGVQVNGYCSDITRTFVMGEPTEAQRKLYETVLAANLAAIRTSRAGIPLSAVDQAARDVIAKEGYGPLFTHRVGHGFGMDVHEQPSVSGQNHSLIEPGLLFTIEPGIYDPIIGGVRIEDDVYITADGSVEVLTSYPKELIMLG